ncbi:MAG: tryptophan-rich sensory protein [Candidatus Nomurabacteria bacterium]|nr:MAG: tryptophan-rich sensory protein [Candidatus Nomurabacteria bacterium]
MNEQEIYTTWLQPSWAPPAEVFGPVWGVLYLLIVGSFGYVFWQVWRGAWPKYVALPFALNLVFNLVFTPIQFGLQNLWLAALDIVLVWGTIVWAMCAVWRYSKTIAYLQVPYLLWVSFATVLQFSITYLNW